MTRTFRMGARSSARHKHTRTLAVLALVGLPSISMAEDTVKLSPQQAMNLGVRVVHPIPSPTDKTLPNPAQIVIPTPQLWVVCSRVAGMVTGLSVARGEAKEAEAGLCKIATVSQFFVP